MGTSKGEPLGRKPLKDQTNMLLRALGAEGRRRLADSSIRVTLKSKQVLYQPDERISHIYFPETAVLAMVTMMGDGASIESATVGREGASWISASFHSPSMPCQTMVAVGGKAVKAPADVVEHEIRDNGTFHNVLSAYGHALLIQTLRSTACNGLHSIQQRAARWMLTTLDRTITDDFEITHEFFGSLLGVRRASVSTMVEHLASLHIIEVARGKICVNNRARLELVSCECYGIIREAYEIFKSFTESSRVAS